MARDPACGSRPHRLLRPPRAGDRRTCRARIPRRRTRSRRALGAGQAPFHWLAHRSQAARVRRDVLQLGVGEDSSPRVFPQPLHLRAPGDLDRVHRRRSAFLSQLLPAANRPSQCVGRHRPRLSASSAASPTSAATSRMWSPRCARRFPRPFRLEANHQIQVLGSPFFRNQTAYIVGRIVNGTHTYPFVVPVKHDVEGKLYFDALLMKEADLAILFSANRAYFLVDMEVPADYVKFLQRNAGRQDGRRALHDARAAEGRQEPFLSRFPPPLEALARQVHRRAGHQGTRDERVHAAVVPLRIQGDPRPYRRVEGHGPPEESSRSTRW